jgi:hypothetical protein
LLPLQNEHLYIAGTGKENLGRLIDDAIGYIKNQTA